MLMKVTQLNSLTSGVLIHTAQLAYVEEAAGTHAFLEVFSDIFRYLTRERRSIVLEEELQFLKKYIHLKELRFPGRFEVEILNMGDTDDYYVTSGDLIGFIDEVLSSSLDDFENMFFLRLSREEQDNRVFTVQLSHDSGQIRFKHVMEDSHGI